MGPGTAFYGVTTIGTKGQVVIPVEARNAMNMQPGEKLIVIGRQHPTKGFGVVCLCPVSSADSFIEEMTDLITSARSAIKLAKDDTPKEE